MILVILYNIKINNSFEILNILTSLPKIIIKYFITYLGYEIIFTRI
jgi:hypothetical protein